MNAKRIGPMLLVVGVVLASCAPPTVDDPESAIRTVEEIHMDVSAILTPYFGEPDENQLDGWRASAGGCYTVDPTDTVRWGRNEIWFGPHESEIVRSAMADVQAFFEERGQLFDVTGVEGGAEGETRIRVRAGSLDSDAVYWFSSLGFEENVHFFVETGCLESGSYQPPA